MIEKKAKKGVQAKKKKTAKKPAGKADPTFLTKLSRAIEEEYRMSGRVRASLDGSAPPTDVSVQAPAPAEERPASGPKTRSPAAAAKPKKVRTSSAKGGNAKERRKALLEELTALLSELDEEGLDFLLEQAHVHRYNMEIERLNESEDRRISGRAPGKTPPGAGKKAGSGVPPLRIERSQDGNTYHIVSGGRYKMFSDQEMLALVRIAFANPEPIEAARGLHRWMSRERIDALADLGVSSPSDPLLAALAALITKTFAKPPRGR